MCNCVAFKVETLLQDEKTILTPIAILFASVNTGAKVYYLVSIKRRAHGSHNCVSTEIRRQLRALFLILLLIVYSLLVLKALAAPKRGKVENGKKDLQTKSKGSRE